ncbi:13396_t:CDS:2 [Acaulospora morrowiae]|uniref:13396_t:CDS:1 n=1 Tax=Acaulospora morrowiae TaxID=94023 RepID=A0A9N8VHC3_9GLOM|nr:13396_t:CDS:2 [Acaulospora morrowiae]
MGDAENSGSKDAGNAEDVEGRIILNVGGVKYETRRSTLTAHPSTLLGTMFQQRNQTMLHPTNGNEYFIDRDGKLFRYVLQFYRTNKVIFPEPGVDHINREELEKEYDYFQLPHVVSPTSVVEPPNKSSPIRKLVSRKLDEFVSALRTIILEVSRSMLDASLDDFNVTITITFSKDGLAGGMTSLTLKPKNEGVSKLIWKIMYDHARIGYFMLLRFGEEIGNCLSNEMPEISWELNHKIYGQYERFYDIKLTIGYKFNRDEVLINSCLADVY